ncbi:MAG: ABC transporter permease [Rhodospirillales bacterium]
MAISRGTWCCRRVTIALVVYASLARFFAESVDGELARPYARTAAAKGLAFPAILLRHVAPNAVRPLVTLVGLSLPGVFSASVVVESVFSYPGLGWLLWRSALARDYPVLIGIVLVVGVVTIVGNLAADFVNAMLDPRLRKARALPWTRWGLRRQTPITWGETATPESSNHAMASPGKR